MVSIFVYSGINNNVLKYKQVHNFLSLFLVEDTERCYVSMLIYTHNALIFDTEHKEIIKLVTCLKIHAASV